MIEQTFFTDVKLITIIIVSITKNFILQRIGQTITSWFPPMQKKIKAVISCMNCMIECHRW